MSTIPAISLWQPWASLWVSGEKKIETRSWRFPYTYKTPQVIAVHAAKKWNSELQRLCGRSPFAERLRTIGIDAARSMKIGRMLGAGSDEPVKQAYDILPLGCIVGVVRVTECVQTEELRKNSKISDVELIFGDYSVGRWGWVADAFLRLAEPVPFRGRQGFFEWEPHDGIKHWIACGCPNG